MGSGASEAIGGRGGGPLRAFRSRDFSLFWLGSLFSIVSFFILLLARGWLVLELTDSAFMVTAVAATSQLPSLFLSPFGGVMADRLSRRTILLAGEAVNMTTLAVLAVLVTTDTIEVWHIFVTGAIHGASFALAFPARAAVVPSLVPRHDIANGVALSSTMFSGAQMLGPWLAGELLGLGRTLSIGASGPVQMMWLAFLVPALASAAALAIFVPVRVPRFAPEGGAPLGSVAANIIEGLGYIRRHQVLTGLMGIGFVAVVFGMPYQTVLPVFARDILDVGERGLGRLGLAGGVGALGGSLAVAAFNSPRAMRRFLAAGGLGLGVAIVAFALSNVYVASLFFALIAGFFFQLVLTSNFALLQVLVPDSLRGRVLSIRFIIFGMSPAGIFALGAAAESYGTPLATVGTGVACFAGAALMLLLFPGLRRVSEAEGRGQVIEVKAAPAPLDVDA